jgi:hypothetical protein
MEKMIIIEPIQLYVCTEAEYWYKFWIKDKLSYNLISKVIISYI